MTGSQRARCSPGGTLATPIIRLSGCPKCSQNLANPLISSRVEEILEIDGRIPSTTEFTKFHQSEMDAVQRHGFRHIA